MTRILGLGLLLSLLGAVFALAACEDGDDGASLPRTEATGGSVSATGTLVPSTTATATLALSASPSPTLAVLANHPPGTRTGIPDVDVVLEALESGSVADIAVVTAFVTRRCVAQETPSRHPLACRQGMADGDPLTGLFFFDVEGGLMPRDEALQFLASGLSGRLYGVFRHEEETRPEVPDREYGIVFLDTNVPGYGYVSVDVAAGQIVSIEAFRVNPLMQAHDDPRWVLPPLDVVSAGD